jgi:CRP-like cAMP-binding protein
MRYRARMKDLFCRQLLERLGGGPLPEWDAFATTVRRRTLAPGEAIFEVDVPWPWLSVVTRGLVKLVYLRADGGERIKSFIAEGGFFASLAGLAPPGRTCFAAVALAETEVEQIGYAQLLELGDRHIAWQRALRSGIEHYGARKEKRERELLTLTPLERYRVFLAEEPALAARIAQKDLALYLGITPVALSRIRGRLAKSVARDRIDTVARHRVRGGAAERAAPPKMPR